MMDKNGRTPLIMAAISNNLAVLNDLIEAGANVNAKDEAGKTALMHAAENNNVSSEIICALLESGADVDATGDIWYALTRAPNNEIINYSWTALMRAAAGNTNKEIILKLLEYGAEIEAKDENTECTSLMLAAGMNPNPEIISVLIENEADVNSQNYEGFPAVALAAIRNPNREIISLLIEKGAEIVSSVLMHKLESELNWDNLVTWAAPINIKEEERLARLKLLKYAFKKKYQKNYDLYDALRTNKPQNAMVLIRNGSDVNMKDNDGDTSLMWAIFGNCSFDVVKTLIKAGSCVNAVTELLPAKAGRFLSD